MAVPNTFATATSAIPLANLDANFAYYDGAFSISGTATTFAGSVTLTSGTANGVPYLNGSKVLTTGSALTFDGTEVFKNSGGTIQYNDVRGSAAAGTRLSAGGTLGTDSFDLFQNSSAGYVFNRANTPLIFGINNSEQMRLTSTGLGIGQSSPAYIVDAYSPASVASSLCRIRVQGTTNYSIFQAQNTGGILWAGLENSAGGSLFSGTAAYSGVIGTTAAYPLAFATNGTERMRIDSSGNLLVGTTSAGGGASLIAGAFAGNAKDGLHLQDTTTTSGTVFAAWVNSSGTVIGSISRVTTTNAVTYNTTSDYRLKDVIGTVSGSGERIDALKPIDYQWKEDGTYARGFLAHEFKEVYANSVTGTKDAVDEEGNPVYQAMQASTPEVIADLVAEIQSLRKRLAALEAR